MRVARPRTLCCREAGHKRALAKYCDGPPPKKWPKFKHLQNRKKHAENALRGLTMRNAHETLHVLVMVINNKQQRRNGNEEHQ